jgi:Tfp pilus assembly protein FimV
LSQLTNDQHQLVKNQHQLANAVNQLALAVHQAAQAASVQAAQRASDSHELLINSGVALVIVAVLALLAGWLVAGRILRPLRTTHGPQDLLHQPERALGSRRPAGRAQGTRRHPRRFIWSSRRCV